MLQAGGVGTEGGGGGGAVPRAIWQRHRHLHNVIFYLISRSKCNQKLMRTPSCLADWQHDSALTPNTDAPHPNDAILKPPLCSYTYPIHISKCGSEKEEEERAKERGREGGKWVCASFGYCAHTREGSNFII